MSAIRDEIIARVTGQPYLPKQVVEITKGQRVVDANVETYNPETHFVQETVQSVDPLQSAQEELGIDPKNRASSVNAPGPRHAIAYNDDGSVLEESKRFVNAEDWDKSFVENVIKPVERLIVEKYRTREDQVHSGIQVSPNDKEELVAAPVDDNIEVVNDHLKTHEAFMELASEPGLDPAAQGLDSIEDAHWDDATGHDQTEFFSSTGEVIRLEPDGRILELASGGVVEDTNTYIVGEQGCCGGPYTGVFFSPEFMEAVKHHDKLPECLSQAAPEENPVMFTTSELYKIKRLVGDKLDQLFGLYLMPFVDVSDLNSILGSVDIELRYRGEVID